MTSREAPLAKLLPGWRGMEWAPLLTDSKARHLVTAPLAVAAITVILTPRVENGLPATLSLLLLVVGTGLCAVHRTARRTGDPRVTWLGDLFLIELIVAMVVLFQGWTPQLDRLSGSYGYDPQRYYFEAQDWVAAGYSLAAIPSLNYTGIIVYYGAVFTVFGHNPVAPALINLLLSLLTALLVVRTAYWVTAGAPRGLWLVGAFIVLPEVLWYDVLTSREIPAMALVTAVTLVGTRPLVGAATTAALRDVVVAAISLLALGVMRTAMVIPVVASMAALAVRGPVWRRHRSMALLLTAAGAAVVIAAPIIAGRLGSYAFTYSSAVGAILERKKWVLDTFEFSDRSLGVLLIPDSVPGAIALAPLRVLLYLVAPWPVGLVNPDDLAAGSWDAWQRLAAGTSSLLYISLFPFALASAATLLNKRRWVRGLVFHIPMWLSLVAISSGNLMISERYRVMILPLLWACIWLGFSVPPRTIWRAYLAWIITLGGFAVLFLAVKAGLFE